MTEFKPEDRVSSRRLPEPPHRSAATRVLFLNTQCRSSGADVAVHLSLLRHFDPAETRGYLISNSQAVDAAELRAALTRFPRWVTWFSPFGRSSESGTRVDAIASLLPLSVALLQAVTRVRRHRIDVIHATDRPRDAFAATTLGRLTRTPVVLQMHSNCGPHLSRFTQAGLRRANAVFAVSSYLRDELIAFGLDPARVHVLHNATDADHFSPGPFQGMRSAMRERYRIPGGAPLVGIVARINPWKGQRELIDAVADLTPRLPDLHLMIVGGGTVALEQAMKEHAAARGVGGRVRFVGFHADVRPFLAAMDLFTLPSYEEPFGLAITEAMAMALPVIACRSGGVPEIVTHERDGYLVEPRSAPSLAAAIARLLDSADLRALLGRRARQTVRERFCPSAQALRASRLYETFLADSHSTIVRKACTTCI